MSKVDKTAYKIIKISCSKSSMEKSEMLPVLNWVHLSYLTLGITQATFLGNSEMYIVKG
jgi:hypothetical protein